MPVIKLYHTVDIVDPAMLSQRLIEGTRQVLKLTATMIEPLIVFIPCDYLSGNGHFYLEVAYRPAVPIDAAQLNQWLVLLSHAVAPEHIFPVRLLEFANDRVHGAN